PEDTWAVLDGLERLVRRAAGAGARVVVWPEYGVFVRGEDRVAFHERVAALARDSGTAIVGGWIDVDAPANRAILASPDGAVDDYTKRHLVLYVESSWLSPGGRSFGALTASGTRVAANICYDLDFPAGPRAAGR